MKLLIISGRSAAGKSISLHVLEELGFYCIDSLPITLLPALVSQLRPTYEQFAVSIDARSIPNTVDKVKNIIDELKTVGVHCEIIYLDADENSLLRRFSETGRKHPLTNATVSLQEALLLEQEFLQPLAFLADLRVDTNRLTAQQIRDLIRSRISVSEKDELSLLFQSFGYKFGVPADTDYVFDVRCLPNPYWEPSLRSFTGLDEAVKTFMQAHPTTQKMCDDIKRFLNDWIPNFVKGNRNYMNISIGCTGGQHRSVYIAETLKNYFKQYYNNIQVRHRELL